MGQEQILILEIKLELNIGTLKILHFESGGLALISPTPLFKQKYLNNETRENSNFRQQIRAD